MGHQQTVPVMLNPAGLTDEPAWNEQQVQPFGDLGGDAGISTVNLLFAPSVELDMTDRQSTVIEPGEKRTSIATPKVFRRHVPKLDLLRNPLPYGNMQVAGSEQCNRLERRDHIGDVEKDLVVVDLPARRPHHEGACVRCFFRWYGDHGLICIGRPHPSKKRRRNRSTSKRSPIEKTHHVPHSEEVRTKLVNRRHQTDQVCLQELMQNR